MTVELGDYESGLPYKGDYAADLARLERRLEQAQAAFIGQHARAMIVFEGWDASGKGGAIRRLTNCWDPRWFEVWPIGAPTDAEREHHFLWRFWQRLPARGNISVFDRSWYGRVLVERVEGFCSPAEWNRAYDEINEFEAQQRDSGTLIIKIFLHVTQQEQDKRLKARLKNPWKNWKIGPDDFRNRAHRAAYLEAYGDMFERCHTRWAPWIIVDGNRKKAARISCLTAIASQLEAWVDMTPPALDPRLADLAEAAFGDTGSTPSAVD